MRQALGILYEPSQTENVSLVNSWRLLWRTFSCRCSSCPLRDRIAHPHLLYRYSRNIFARLHLATQFFEVRYMPGVTGFVSTGCEPLAVSEEIVDSVRSRCTDSILQLNPIPLRRGEHVRVVEGPFRDFEAIFENYLSGTKRVAILMKSIEGCGVRVVANASAVVRLSPQSGSLIIPSNRI
jgi:hypothetical protein